MALLSPYSPSSKNKPAARKELRNSHAGFMEIPRISYFLFTFRL